MSMRSQRVDPRITRIVLFWTFLSLVVAAPQLAMATASPTVAASHIYAVVQGQSGPLGDVTVTEGASGQLPASDVITFRFTDATSGSTIHLTSTPAVGGTHGLAASAAIASSSGTLQDEVLVTISSPSTGSFPGVLTLTRLTASIDPGAAVGNDVVRVSDTGSVIASSGSPVTTADANAVGAAPRATFSAVSKPTLSSTGFDQAGGDLTITEPAKAFFKTGDVITFWITDGLGSADTVGLAGPPTASGSPTRPRSRCTSINRIPRTAAHPPFRSATSRTTPGRRRSGRCRFPER
jgi:hypothetical protein